MQTRRPKRNESWNYLNWKVGCRKSIKCELLSFHQHHFHCAKAENLFPSFSLRTITVAWRSSVLKLLVFFSLHAVIVLLQLNWDQTHEWPLNWNEFWLPWLRTKCIVQHSKSSKRDGSRIIRDALWNGQVKVQTQPRTESLAGLEKVCSCLTWIEFAQFCKNKWIESCRVQMCKEIHTDWVQGASPYQQSCNYWIHMEDFFILHWQKFEDICSHFDIKLLDENEEHFCSILGVHVYKSGAWRHWKHNFKKTFYVEAGENVTFQ